MKSRRGRCKHRKPGWVAFAAARSLMRLNARCSRASSLLDLMEIFKTACCSVLHVEMEVSFFATWYVLSGGLGSNSHCVLYKPDSRAPSVGHFSEDLVSVAEKVADAHSKPYLTVKTRERFLADKAGLLTLNGAFVCEPLLDLRQSRCQLHRHLIVL